MDSGERKTKTKTGEANQFTFPQSVSRFAVAEYRMKHWKLQREDKLDDHKTNDDLEKERTLIVASVHLNYRVASTLKRDPPHKDIQLKRFYDDLARAIVKFNVRLVNGDFDMDTIRAVTELRVRGLCVNVAAWCPWLKSEGELSDQDERLGHPRLQLASVLILVVGPTDGVRVPYNLSVFGMQTPSAVAECCKQLYRRITDEAGHLVREEEWPLQRYRFNGSGHQLSAFRPHAAEIKNNVSSG